MTPFTPEHWMTLALQLAQEGEKLDEVPVGALLVHENQVIGQGYNLREKSGRTVAHAEIMALEDYNQRTGEWRLPTDCSLYVTVEPCLMCTGALLSARVEHLFYGASDPKNAGLSVVIPFIEQGRFDHRFKEVRGGILQKECSQILSSYFKAKRNK